MDRIYSRKRIKIPKLKVFYSENKRAKKIFKVMIILLIAIFTFYMIIESINPIFLGICRERAINLATDIMNFETNKILANYDYANLVTIEKNGEDSTSILKTDIVVINEISTEIALAVVKRMENLKDEKIAIPIGVITGNKYLAGVGPKIDIKIIAQGNIKTKLETEFESKGINQTVYRIYLNLMGEMEILTPYDRINEHIENQVLLVETVIVGNVPNTYLNLDQGLNRINMEQ